MSPWLRATCAAQAISRAELARRSGLNQSTLSMVGRGQYEPTLRMCRALADGLGLPLEELLLASRQLLREPEIARDVRALMRDLEALPSDIARRIVAAWRDMVELAKSARETA